MASPRSVQAFDGYFSANAFSTRTSRATPAGYQYPVEELDTTIELDTTMHFLPRAFSMDLDNDPRFSAPTVLSKRLGAFHMIAVAAVLMLNLAIGQAFQLMPGVGFDSPKEIACSIGFCLMCSVFVANLFSAVIFSQQLYMTYRLETSGNTGFEMAKSFYLNSNIVTMRHTAVKSFLHYGIPVFILGMGCMVFSHFSETDQLVLAIPVCTLIGLFGLGLIYVNWKHGSVFTSSYHMVAAHHSPLHTHLQRFNSRSGLAGGGTLDT